MVKIFLLKIMTISFVYWKLIRQITFFYLRTREDLYVFLSMNFQTYDGKILDNTYPTYHRLIKTNILSSVFPFVNLQMIVISFSSLKMAWSKEVKWNCMTLNDIHARL